MMWLSDTFVFIISSTIKIYFTYSWDRWTGAFSSSSLLRLWIERGTGASWAFICFSLLIDLTSC
jgi:hypothetical protein